MKSYEKKVFIRCLSIIINMCEHQKFVRKNIVSSAKRTWQHIWGLQSCIWNKVKTSGTMSSETNKTNGETVGNNAQSHVWRTANSVSAQTIGRGWRADVATEPGQRAVVESTVDSSAHQGILESNVTPAAKAWTRSTNRTMIPNTERLEKKSITCNGPKSHPETLCWDLQWTEEDTNSSTTTWESDK